MATAAPAEAAPAADVKLRPHVSDEWRAVVERHGAALQEHYDGDSPSYVDEQGKSRTALPWERYRYALDTRWPEIGAPLLKSDLDKLDDKACEHLLAKIRAQLQRHLSKSAASKLFESWQRAGFRAACVDLAARLAGEQDYLARVAAAEAPAPIEPEPDPLADPTPTPPKLDPLTTLFADTPPRVDDVDEVEEQSQRRASKRSRGGLGELLFGAEEEEEEPRRPPIVYDDVDEVIGWPKRVSPRRSTTMAGAAAGELDDVFL